MPCIGDMQLYLQACICLHLLKVSIGHTPLELANIDEETSYSESPQFAVISL